MSCESAKSKRRPRNWMKIVLRLAGLYNLLWGAVVVLFPALLFELTRLEPPRYPEIWQCLGMVVGVYGVGYLIAAADPFRHWPIVFVGLLGKILGPIGFLLAAVRGDLPRILGVTIVTNDLIWWVPFAAILVVAWWTVPERDSEKERAAREDDGWEINLYYDGGCPLCKREVALFRRLDRHRKIKFTDIASPEFEPEHVGINMARLMAEIHARLPDGTWLRGVEVLRRIYSAIGFAWIVPISRLPLISQACDLCYRLFAKQRLRLTGRCASRGDGCQIENSPPKSASR